MLGTKFRMWFRESVLDPGQGHGPGSLQTHMAISPCSGTERCNITWAHDEPTCHSSISRLSSPPAEQEFLLPGHILQGRRLGFKVAMSLCQASKLWGEGSCWGLLVLWTQGFHGFRLCAEHSLQFFRGQQ